MTDQKTEADVRVAAAGGRWPVVRSGWPLIGACLAAAAVSAALGWASLAAAAILGAAFFVWFFRNPERTAPPGDQFIVSPADGKVMEIEPCREERFLRREMIRLGIFMSPVDVHVNRMPCAGKVAAIHYFPGRYLMAFNPKASLENEHQVMVIDADRGAAVLVVQIAGFLARRIESWVRTGDHLRRGDRFGMIRLGSKVDVYLPPSTTIKARIGERVRAGESVVGVWS
ncbi:MAG: phosphatidylserine decarboxylase family protein [Nitrospirota bacterium]